MLIDVVRFVREDFVRSNCPAQVFYGKAKSEKNTSPNRVTFWPTNDNFGAADQSLHSPEVYKARSILTRVCGFECEIWAAAPKQADGAQQFEADDGALNALINQVILSLERCAQGIDYFTGGTTAQEVLTVNRGLLYTLKGTVAVPVLDIQFPDGAIGPDVETWTLVSGVTQNASINLIDPEDDT